MDLIKEWLNGARDYDAGVSLYMQLGDDPVMKSLFREFRTPFKEKKLLELLRGLLNRVETEKQTVEVKAQKLKKENSGWPVEMSKEMKALKDTWQPLYKEMMSLCARIYDVAKLGTKDKNKELEAGQMAHRILDLRDQIKEIYSDRDFYLQHGHFPGKEQLFVPVVDPLKLAERRLTVRRYLSRLKRELSKSDKPHIRLKQGKDWAKYEAEMKYINTKLNRPENEGIPERKQAAERQSTDQGVPGGG